MSASIALASNVLTSACWYKIIAMGEIGEGEQDGMSSMKAGMTGEVYVEFVADMTGGVIDTLSWKWGGGTGSGSGLGMGGLLG